MRAKITTAYRNATREKCSATDTNSSFSFRRLCHRIKCHMHYFTKEFSKTWQYRQNNHEIGNKYFKYTK